MQVYQFANRFDRVVMLRESHGPAGDTLLRLDKHRRGFADLGFGYAGLIGDFRPTDLGEIGDHGFVAGRVFGDKRVIYDSSGTRMLGFKHALEQPLDEGKVTV